MCHAHARPCPSTGWALNRRFGLTSGTVAVLAQGGGVSLHQTGARGQWGFHVCNLQPNVAFPLPSTSRRRYHPVFYISVPPPESECANRAYSLTGTGMHFEFGMCPSMNARIVLRSAGNGAWIPVPPHEVRSKEFWFGPVVTQQNMERFAAAIQKVRQVRAGRGRVGDVTRRGAVSRCVAFACAFTLSLRGSALLCTALRMPTQAPCRPLSPLPLLKCWSPDVRNSFAIWAVLLGPTQEPTPHSLEFHAQQSMCKGLKGRGWPKGFKWFGCVSWRSITAGGKGRLTGQQHPLLLLLCSAVLTEHLAVLLTWSLSSHAMNVHRMTHATGGASDSSCTAAVICALSLVTAERHDTQLFLHHDHDMPGWTPPPRKY